MTHTSQLTVEHYFMLYILVRKIKDAKYQFISQLREKSRCKFNLLSGIKFPFKMTGKYTRQLIICFCLLFLLKLIVNLQRSVYSLYAHSSLILFFQASTEIYENCITSWFRQEIEYIHVLHFKSLISNDYWDFNYRLPKLHFWK